MKEKGIAGTEGASPTFEEFRVFLRTVMDEVKDGTLDHERASLIIKLAQEINRSIRLELLVAGAFNDGSKIASKFGKLKLAGKD